MAPGARAHAGARLPGQVVVVHEAVFTVGEVGQGLAFQFLRGAFADHAPYPTALFLGELCFPACAVHFQRSCGRIVEGQLDDGQGHQLLGARTDGGDLLVQVLGRVADDGVHHAGPIRVEQAHGLAGHARAVGVHGQARTLPGGFGLELPAGQQRLRCGRAAIVGLALGVPERAHPLRGEFGRHAAAGGVEHEGVAAHLPVVVHAKAR
ncbi:hypothetical protein FQZ97_897000 [compost metagenome]